VTRKSSTNDRTGVRTLLDVDLVEVSVVTFPANASATVTSVKRRTGDGIAGLLTAVQERQAIVRHAHR